VFLCLFFSRKPFADMTVPYLDQDFWLIKMKDASLPLGVREECYWCGDLAKVEDFSDTFGMKFLCVPTMIMMHRQVCLTQNLWYVLRKMNRHFVTLFLY
jgi:hypothetical protein